MKFMEEQPLISVIIPTYNRATLIERSVRSVLDQTYSNLEVLVVDDGSTDDTEERVAAICDERLHFIRQPSNAGASVARNVGVEHASAELIAFQDSDDVWHPDKLEKQMRHWKEHPEYDVIYCSYDLHFLNGAEVKIPIEDDTWGNLEGKVFDTLLVNNTVGTPTMLFRKKVFQEVEGFDTSLQALEDWDLALRMAEKVQFGYISEPLMDAYQMGDGISTRTAGYYHARCKEIGRYRSRLMELGIFDAVVEEVFLRAQRYGIQSQVQQMLMLALQGKL